MTNFYSALEIDPSLPVEEIQEKLLELESIWRKREIARPEIAIEKLSLISQAKKVFETEASRQRYDKEIKSDHHNDEDANRAQQFTYWCNSATGYISEKEYDLAESTIQKARKFTSGDEDESTLNYLSAVLNKEKGRELLQAFVNSNFAVRNQNAEPILNEALKAINSAIVAQPNNIEYYSTAADIMTLLSYCYRYIFNNENEANQVTTKKRQSLTRAINRLEKEKVNSLPLMLALAQSYIEEFPSDVAMAEKYAATAQQKGDKSGISQEVLDKCNQPRRVQFSELASYQSEKCLCWEEIEKKKKQICEFYLSSATSETGWVLITKDKHHRLTDSYNQDEIDNATFTYCLNTKGQFVVITDKLTEKEYGAPARFMCDTKNTKETFTLDERPEFGDNFLSEFDFECSLGNAYDRSISFSCTSAWYWRHMSGFSEADSVITRIHKNKGAGLLKKLNDIIQSNEPPINIDNLIHTYENGKLTSKPNNDEKKVQESNNSILIRGKDFTSELVEFIAKYELRFDDNGFNTNEVDEFLDSICEDVEAAKKKIEALINVRSSGESEESVYSSLISPIISKIEGAGFSYMGHGYSPSSVDLLLKSIIESLRSRKIIIKEQEPSTKRVKRPEKNAEHMEKKDQKPLLFVIIALVLDVLLLRNFISSAIANNTLPSGDLGFLAYILTYIVFLFYCYKRGPANGQTKAKAITIAVWIVLSFVGITFIVQNKGSLAVSAVLVGLITPILVFAGEKVVVKMANKDK